MSKQAIVWGCALVTLVGFSLSGKLVAQQQGEDPFADKPAKSVHQPARPVEGIGQSAEQRINAALDQRLKTPLNYEAEPLNIVLLAIADEYNLPIVFDKAALDEVAISPESEVSVNLRNISLRAALNLMFKEPGLEDLCYMIDEEVLLITTEEKANETLLTKVYRVDDFEMTNEHSRPRGASAWAVYSPIISVITSCVAHDSWMTHGTGEGEIRLVKPGMLVITQTRRVHDQVKKLFDKLRATKQQILKDAGSRASVAKPVTRGFAISVNLGKNPEQVQQQISAAIKSSVDWSAGELAEKETWVEMLSDRVLVRHLPSVLQQIEIVLDDMHILKRENFHGYSAGGGRSGGGGFF